MRYSLLDCFLGSLLFAATDRGICFLCFGDSAQAAFDSLRVEYPAAALDRDDAGLSAWRAALTEHLAGQLDDIELPVDARGTPFQQSVWAQLRRIPYGQTRTYTQMAEALGRPDAVRAVAHGCATNPVSLLIPCHRVLRRDGSLGGYRWGLARKQALLAHEARS